MLQIRDFPFFRPPFPVIYDRFLNERQAEIRPDKQWLVLCRIFGRYEPQEVYHKKPHGQEHEICLVFSLSGFEH